MKSFLLAICLIMAAQSRQFGGRSQSSLQSEGSTIVGGRFGASTAGASRFGASSAASSAGFNQPVSSGFGQPASSGYSAPVVGAQPAAPSYEAPSTGTATGTATGTSTGFATGTSTGTATGTSTGFATGSSASASQERPTFEQPSTGAAPQVPQAPQAPQAPQVPQAPQAPAAPQEPSTPFACFSADANRISMAKCPQADAENKCVNMPNCVWGLEGYSSSSARTIGKVDKLETQKETQPVALTAGKCVWDQEMAMNEGDFSPMAVDVAREQTICASYSEDECADAALGLKSALCKWEANAMTATNAESTILENVHGLVVGAMNARLSALDMILGVAFLITAAFGIHQFQQWCKEREHSKSGLVAKADWEEREMHMPIF